MMQMNVFTELPRYIHLYEFSNVRVIRIRILRELGCPSIRAHCNRALLQLNFRQV